MRKTYIPSPNYFMNFSAVNSTTPGFCTPIKKHPIDKIKFSKKYLSFANIVREKDINWIISDLLGNQYFLIPKII